MAAGRTHAPFSQEVKSPSPRRAQAWPLEHNAASQCLLALKAVKKGDLSSLQCLSLKEASCFNA